MSTEIPLHLQKKSGRQKTVENYTQGGFKPKVDWEWVGCSKTEFAVIEEEAAKKRRMKAKIQAGFAQLDDLEQMILDLEEEEHEEDISDQLEDIEESLGELWKMFVKPGDRKKGTHLTSRLGSLEDRLKKLSVSGGDQEEEEDDDDEGDYSDDEGTIRSSRQDGSFDEDDSSYQEDDKYSFFDRDDDKYSETTGAQSDHRDGD